MGRPLVMPTDQVHDCRFMADKIAVCAGFSMLVVSRPASIPFRVTMNRTVIESETGEIKAFSVGSLIMFDSFFK
ncbi:hypothetical protein C4F40_01235 [Sphingobacterium sp. Ka21]|uniref:Uncharacterized protein n=1 Tax=Sphingobacterium pedocola TaxID=2082722 RepID=A0ABR9T2Y7_9SPHI|nr:hypothetical protein [Sphingobacterium pedocola]